MMAGTLGYMAPEMPHTGKATKESDVYSFGVVTLEVMCSARPLDVIAIERGDGILVDRVWRAHEAGNILLVADTRLGTTFPNPSHNSGSGSGLDSNPQEASSIFDPSDAALESDKKMMTNLLLLGLLCCDPNPEDRPTMRMVSQWLQSSEAMEMSMPSLPRCKPQARYSKPGFSHMAMIRSPPTSSAIVVNIQEAVVQVLQQSPTGTPPSSNASHGEHVDVQQSFASNSSSVLSGR